MEIQNRRRDLSLGEHVVDLAAVVGLVVEEVRDQQLDAVLQGPALVVHVVDRRLQEPLVDTGGEASSLSRARLTSRSRFGASRPR